MNFKQLMAKSAAPALVAAIITAAGIVPVAFAAFKVTSSVPSNCTSGYGYDAGYGYGYGYESSTCTTPGSSAPIGGGSAYNPTPVGSTNNGSNSNNGNNSGNTGSDNTGTGDTDNIDGSTDDGAVNPAKWTMTSIDGQLCKAYASGFDPESRGAYLYACVNNITTKRDISSSIFYGPVIRKEFAKMISNYAVNVMGMTPDTTRVCNFNDVNGEDAEMMNSIKMACQLGLMGYKGNGLEKLMGFEPNGIVNRAQFGTVISRMLYGNKYEADANSTNWYTAHLQALKANGILNMINDPMMNEVRGYVWIVFERLQN